MPYSFARSQELFQRAQRCIAGGINSGIRKLETPVPIYFVRAHAADDIDHALERARGAFRRPAFTGKAGAP
jgi:glutamate-1-semialdehyde aminotransferase